MSAGPSREIYEIERQAARWSELVMAAPEGAPGSAVAAGLATCVMEVIRGGQSAQRALQQIDDGQADVDALHSAATAVLQSGQPERLRGFMRELQKALERAVALVDGSRA